MKRISLTTMVVVVSFLSLISFFLQSAQADPVISVAPRSVNLGNIPAGNSSPSKAVTVRNKGTSDLSVSSITITGTNASEFNETTDCTTLPPGSSCSIVVTFTSAEPYSKKSSIMSIVSNDPKPKRSTINVKLSGKTPPPKISARPMTVNLGSVSAGSGSSPKAVTVKNTGLSDLLIGGITITGPDAGEFSQISDCAVLTSKSTCSISFGFNPATTGRKTAAANIPSNDPKKPNIAVKLVGRGLTGSGGGGGGGVTQAIAVFPFNDLGMHCLDKDFSVFSILPPFNVLHAQLVRKGVAGSIPQILNDTQASVYYSAVTDSAGSINTTSVSKTNFWDFVLPLYGISLPPDTGFLGFKMPGASNTPQSFSVYYPEFRWFAAEGIPITPIDDQHLVNSYPLMRIQAIDSVTSLASPSIYAVVPVSDEMHCSDCHGTGGAAANNTTMQKYGIQSWSNSSNPEIQYKENILILHGALVGVDFIARKPVLCSSCHYMLPLDLAGTGPQGDQVGKPLLSKAIHGRHGKTLNGQIPSPSNPAIIPDNGTSTCYSCHPGTVTKCLRGAMGDAGIVCQQCHGGLLAVSGEFKGRTPWVDLPKCQSCHTGDAVDHLGSTIRGTTVYDPADPSATPIIATNKRFAEENGKLYRFSSGHGGMACEACHGSTHAEWPVNSTISDNVAAIQLQGHTGPIIECTTCHTDGPPLSLNGPHGMHNVNDRNWNEHHENFYEQNPTRCKTCHGVNLEGTVLSRAAVDRTLNREEGGNVFVAKGTQIHCALCHGNPLFDN